jgi:hypothetical protein
MHKKIISWLLAFIMIFQILGIANLEALSVDTYECKIGETEYALLADALTNSVDGDTITLLKNVYYTGQISISGKKITFDLNGFNLNATNNGDIVVEVGPGGEIDLIGEGEFNVTGTNIQGNNFDIKGAVYAHDGGKATVTNVLIEEASYMCHGAYAISGGTITVLGNSIANTGSSTHCRGAQSDGANSMIYIYGNVESANSQGVVAYDNSEIIVHGNVQSHYSAAYAYSSGIITIHGNAISLSEGANAQDGSQIFIGGDSISSYASNGSGAYATGEGSLVNVSGSAISYGDYGYGSFAGSDATVIVHGDSISDGTGGKGVYAVNNATVIVKGDVKAENGVGVWAWHISEDKSYVTIDGEINALTFIELDRNENLKTYTKDEYTTPTTKEGYFTYTDSHSTVWLAYPKIWGIEIESEEQYLFDGGDGSSEESAYEISSANQLSQLAYNVNNTTTYSGKYFKLTDNINLSEKKWVPIGNETNLFQGFFDGSDHTISGLSIGTEAAYDNSFNRIGLFGAIGAQASISNVNLESIAIYSSQSSLTGGLVGLNDGGQINNSGTAGNIFANGSLGGLIGSNKGLIANSYSRANLTSSGSSSGGLVGQNSGGNIYNSYATGNVIAGAYPHAGGLVGYTVDWSGSNIIKNCYATGDVSGSAWGYIGGIFGRNYEGRTTLENTYWNQDAQIIASEYHGYTPYVHGSSENCLAMPSSEMKSETFITQLNNNIPEPQTDYYKWELQSEINDGYPVHGDIFTIEPPSPPRPSTPSIPSPEIVTKSLPDGIEGEKYEIIINATGGISPYVWSAEGLPAGLSMSKEGTISGVPAETGSFTVRIGLLDNRNYYTGTSIRLIIVQTEKQDETEEKIFTDAKGHWSENYIKGIVSKNIITGYPDGTFRPENKITREEFASILIRALELESKTGLYFNDTLDRWSTDNISTAVYHNIIKGYSNQSFGPTDFITREQMAVMIARALELNEEYEDKTFTDIDEAAPWSKSAILSAVSKGLLDGYPDGTFRPKNNLTRAEAIKVVYNLVK